MVITPARRKACINRQKLSADYQANLRYKNQILKSSQQSYKDILYSSHRRCENCSQSKESTFRLPRGVKEGSTSIDKLLYSSTYFSTNKTTGGEFLLRSRRKTPNETHSRFGLADSGNGITLCRNYV